MFVQLFEIDCNDGKATVLITDPLVQGPTHISQAIVSIPLLLTCFVDTVFLSEILVQLCIIVLLVDMEVTCIIIWNVSRKFSPNWKESHNNRQHRHKDDLESYCSLVNL